MSLIEIKDFIEKHDNIAVIGHVNPDGDCIGSCLGLWYLLKSLGKNAAVCIKTDDVPHHLKFIWNPFAEAQEGQVFDAYISVDCASVDRLSCLNDEFKESGHTACIDHHRTNSGFATVNAVVPTAPAAGEIIYSLATDVFGIKPTGELADAIYTAIVSDTGGFKYSSTTSYTMRVGADLLDAGVNGTAIFKNLFDTYTKKQIDIVSDITSTLTTYFDGKVASITVTDELLESKGMRFDEIDFITNLPRSIEGVEVGVYFKKKSDEIRVSLRSGESVDVSLIATHFGGGGHARAAGITFKCGLEEAKKLILDKLAEVL